MTQKSYKSVNYVKVTDTFITLNFSTAPEKGFVVVTRDLIEDFGKTIGCPLVVSGQVQ